MSAISLTKEKLESICRRRGFTIRGKDLVLVEPQYVENRRYTLWKDTALIGSLIPAGQNFTLFIASNKTVDLKGLLQDFPEIHL